MEICPQHCYQNRASQQIVEARRTPEVVKEILNRGLPQLLFPKPLSPQPVPIKWDSVASLCQVEWRLRSFSKGVSFRDHRETWEF